MFIQISHKDDIDWENFFYGSMFEDISKGKNKIWFITIAYDNENRDSISETLIEIDESKRDILLQVDSYIEYSKKKKWKGKFPGNPYFGHIAKKYNFLEKILDHNDNLIIVVAEEDFEYDHPVEVDEYGNPVKINKNGIK